MNTIKLGSFLHEQIPAVVTGFDLIGTFAFAISGAILGKKKEYNFWGILMLGFCTAVGGGTIRNVMVNLVPTILLPNSWMYILSITVPAVVVYYGYDNFHFKDSNKQVIAHRVLARADAIGLAVFVMLGATTAIKSGLPFFAVIAFSVLTGAGGGIIRDVIAGEKPYAFQGVHYITWCVLGGGLSAILKYERPIIEAAIGFTAYKLVFVLVPTLLIIVLRFREIKKEFPS